MAQFKTPSKKATIITAAIIIVLLIIAATGTVMFLRDRGTTEAAQIDQEQVSTQNENSETQTAEQPANEEQTTPQETNTDEVATEEGTDVAQETETQTGTSQSSTSTSQGTGTRTDGTTTTTEDIQESTITRTETEEIPERLVSEDHTVGWNPMDINADIASARINPTKDDVEVIKEGDKTVVQGEVINYTITVKNHTDKKLEGIEVKDVLDDTKLDLTTLEYKTEPHGSLDGNTIKWYVDIEANNEVKIEFSVKVKTSVAPGTAIENKAIANGEESKEVAITEVEEAKTELSGEKIWVDNNDQDGKRPGAVTVILDKTVNGVKTENVATTKTDSNWKYSFENLPKYENGYEITYSVREETVEGYETTIDGTTITNTHTPELYNDNTGKITGTKTWSDADNQDGIRPESITVKLYKTVNGVKTELASKEVTSENNWTYTFENLPKYEGGVEIDYSVEELTVEGYTPAYSGNDNENITNTHTPDLYNEDGVLSGRKVWNDNNNQDGKRPESVTVYLDKEVDGVKTEGIKTTTTDANWEYRFTDLPKYENGKEIIYSVREEAVEGYETTIDGTTITNTHTPELYNDNTGKITGTKTWSDADNQDGIRPESITVKLYKTVNGVKAEVASKEVTSENNWTYTFENLPKYEGGVEIDYSVEEVTVEGYTPAYSGNDNENITNTHTPDLYNEDGVLSGRKVWNDNNNQDGIRPESVTVYLDKEVDGVKTEGIKTTTTDANWEYSFENLPKYENGKEIIYSVREEAVEDYETTIDGTTITNTHTPDLYNEDGVLSGRKVWNDNNNQDGKRPESVTVYLDKEVDGVKTEGIKITTTDANWEYRFTDLPKYENGKEIVYSVREEAVEDYETTIDGTTITNTHTPDLYNEDGVLSGRKVWNDNNNQDGIRPESVTVYLDKEVDGVKTEGIKTTTTDANWEYRFTDLPKYENGKEIIYSVREEAVEDYETTIDGTTITNTHTPDLYNEDGSLSGTKTWVEGENQEGYRPEAIYVRLFANGERAVDVNGNPVADLRVNGDSNVWTYEFNNLPENKNGNPITYTVKELDVNGNPIENNGNYNDGYVTTYDGNNITNTHKESNISIEKNVAELKDNTFVTISDEALKNVMHSVGDEVWYAITVTNNSDFAEENAVVKDTLVNGLTYVEAKINNVNTDAGTEIALNGQEITWTTDLDKEETKTLYIKARINENAISDENFVSSVTTGTETDWWQTDNSVDINNLDPQSNIAKLYIRVDGEILEGNQDTSNNKEFYTDAVGAVRLTNKNLNNSPTTTAENAIKIGTKTTPTTVEGYTKLNYNIFQFTEGGTALKTIAENINNYRGQNGETVHFDPKTQMIVCYVLKYDGSDGYHIDAVIRDRVQTKVDLYKVGNEAVVNGNRDNVDININDITEITQYTVQKEWIDKGRENERPTSVDVQLYANDTYKETVTLTAENNWTHTWNELGKKDSNGNDINYTVKEAVIDNETAKVFENNETNGNYIVTYENAEGKTTITNTYSEPNIAVEKSRVGDNTAVKQGEEITYSITATNTGTASGKVTIKDELATNMQPKENTMVTVETKQLSDGRTIATSEISFEELTQGKEFEVASGTKVVLTFTVTADGYAGEDVNNTADYKKDGEDEFTPTETVKTDLEDTIDLVTSKTVQKADPQKVILLLDYSGSMAGNKKKSMENAVDSFLDVFLPEGTKNQVMVIPYGSDTGEVLNFTSNASSVANFLDRKYANGGTNIHAALEDAYDYIGEDTTVILMTDGEPTYYRYYYNTWYGKAYYIAGDGGDYDKDAADAAKEAATKIKTDSETPCKIYTIGFGIADLNNPYSQMARFMNDIASPANGKDKYCYSSNNEEELTNVFTSIAKTITETENALPEAKETADGIVTLEGIEAGQNVELYTKYVIDEDGNINKQQSTLYNGRAYTWNEFLRLSVTTESGERINLVTYNESRETLEFNLGAFMKYNQIEKDQNFTIRFVDPDAEQEVATMNILSLAINAIESDEINEETVATYEEKFNAAEAEKEETAPVEEEKSEDVVTTTPADEEVKEEPVEGEEQEENTTPVEETPTEQEPVEKPVEDNTTTETANETSNINAEKAE